MYYLFYFSAYILLWIIQSPFSGIIQVYLTFELCLCIWLLSMVYYFILISNLKSTIKKHFTSDVKLIPLFLVIYLNLDFYCRIVNWETSIHINLFINKIFVVIFFMTFILSAFLIFISFYFIIISLNLKNLIMFIFFCF